MLSHGAATAAIVMSLCSFWFAWRTENRAAGLAAAGFRAGVLGVGVTTLAVAGIIPFTPWVLMAMPLGSALEVPFNLYGLRLLEQRRALVLQSRAELARVMRSGGRVTAGDAAATVGRQDERAGHWFGPADAAALSGAGAGSPRLRVLDSVNVEHFLHAMMVACVRPGNHVGRRSFHEIVLRNPAGCCPTPPCAAC
jgi:hypothetical protein